MNERELIKLRSGALYGNTVKHLLDTCKHCPHFNDESFTCDKIHHCDCDCPECSPESYASESDFEENPWDALKIDEILGK